MTLQILTWEVGEEEGEARIWQGSQAPLSPTRGRPHSWPAFPSYDKGHLPTLFCFHHNKATKTSGLRPMEPRDVRAVRDLTNTYLKQFHLAPVMDEEEVAHWFLPQEHIIDTFVVEVKRRC